MTMAGGAVAPEVDFTELTRSYRRELLVHCYRMLGSLDDAEDAVQETYLRAWRSAAEFEGRSSIRVWLYRIATNVCLTMLQRAKIRALPSDPNRPDGQDLAWLQPFPDRLLDADPATVVEARSGVRLAFIAALQHLPARMRAVLILRDVLAFRAAEAAEMLDSTPAAVNNAVLRARAAIASSQPTPDSVTEPAEPRRRALVEKYVAAFERADIDALLSLMRVDVTWEMPPEPDWYAGRVAVGPFVARQVLDVAGTWRLLPTGANGQPALAAYRRSHDGGWHAHGIQVLTVTGDQVTRVVTFRAPELFPAFGLPLMRNGDR